MNQSQNQNSNLLNRFLKRIPLLETDDIRATIAFLKLELKLRKEVDE